MAQQITQPVETSLADNYTSVAPDWKYAFNLVKSFDSDPSFIQILVSSSLEPNDRSTTEYANALSLYGQDYCDNRSKNDTLDQNVIDQIKLLASVPFFLHVKYMLNNYAYDKKTRWLPETAMQEMRTLKPYVIWYNQLMSDYAYANPQGRMDNLEGALIKQALSYYPRQIDTIEEDIQQVTRGARTEAIVRSLLDRTPLNYIPGTIKDDLRGGDLIVEYDNKRVRVDIKTSIGPIARLRGGYEEIQTNNISYAIHRIKRDQGKEDATIVLYPGFTDEDTNGLLSLDLPDNQIQYHADFITKQLHLAFQELHI